VRPYLALTAAVAILAVLASFLSGAHRRGALVGSATASFTALASLLAMGRITRNGKKPVKGALTVMTVMFLVRIVLVSLGTALVARAGESIVGFVLAFFVPYFAFSAIEGAFVHSLGRSQGPSA
jgi:hypothetical protein